MVRNMRNGHDTAFKARAAQEALKGEKTLAQLSSEFEVHANQIRQWRQKLLGELPGLFSDRRKKKGKTKNWCRNFIGKSDSSRWRLSGLKKVPFASVEEKRPLIDPGYTMIPIYRQCELLISECTFYKINK